jgi:tRNA A37 threonylcarbamoyladenosine dehydratase
MAHGLKTKGADELARYKKRVLYQLAHKRISKPDADYIIEHIDLIEAKVVMIIERGEDENG